jgi:hypothetical protein
MQEVLLDLVTLGHKSIPLTNLSLRVEPKKMFMLLGKYYLSFSD